MVRVTHAYTHSGTHIHALTCTHARTTHTPAHTDTHLHAHASQIYMCESMLCVNVRQHVHTRVRMHAHLTRTCKWAGRVHIHSTYACAHTQVAHAGGRAGCALDAALAVWLDRCGELQGRYRLTLAVTALGLLLESNHPRLSQVMVRA